eukprot:jgi/Chlat1/2155/Chrsp17S02850
MLGIQPRHASHTHGSLSSPKTLTIGSPLLLTAAPDLFKSRAGMRRRSGCLNLSWPMTSPTGITPAPSRAGCSLKAAANVLAKVSGAAVTTVVGAQVADESLKHNKE